MSGIKNGGVIERWEREPVQNGISSPIKERGDVPQ